MPTHGRGRRATYLARCGGRQSCEIVGHGFVTFELFEAYIGADRYSYFRTMREISTDAALRGFSFIGAQTDLKPERRRQKRD